MDRPSYLKDAGVLEQQRCHPRFLRLVCGDYSGSIRNLQLRRMFASGYDLGSPRSSSPPRPVISSTREAALRSENTITNRRSPARATPARPTQEEPWLPQFNPSSSLSASRA